jgi:predicted SAM-dependent methyltransferase
MPLDNESQDFVFSTSLFTHLLEDELVNYVRETYRVLRPGGVMQMTVFCIDMMREQGTLGGRFTFRHKAGNAYIESRRYPEAAVAFEREFLLGVASQIGFSSAEVIAGGQDILRCVR